jgi:hypothetical protein
MRLIPLVILAALVAGCAGSSSRHLSARSAVLPIEFKPEPTRSSSMGAAEAVRHERSARGEWLRSLRAGALTDPHSVFPSPPRTFVIRRLEREARTLDFEILSVRMLRPRQLAPVIVVRTTRPVALARATLSILEAIDPSWGRPRELYEGLYFAAVDERGIPLFSVSNVLRRDGRRLYEGGEWARGEALYPLPHY